MTDTNPQEVATPGPNAPKEPGEIGWPANWDHPGDPSVPVAQPVEAETESIAQPDELSPVELSEPVEAADVADAGEPEEVAAEQPEA